MRFQSYFYPRSPCGERQAEQPLPTATIAISIHALLAESDNAANDDEQNTFVFLSTLSLRRATCGVCWMSLWMRYFYPRSPCGERRTKPHLRVPFLISIHALLAESDIFPSGTAPLVRNFYPRSPCGERRFSFWRCTAQRIFLSTLSLRRATLPGGDRPRHAGISIHALLAESDPRSRWVPRHTQISIHALLAESDGKLAAVITGNGAFLSSSPCGERP